MKSYLVNLGDTLQAAYEDITDAHKLACEDNQLAEIILLPMIQRIVSLRIEVERLRAAMETPAESPE